jgi:hypothetical protein
VSAKDISTDNYSTDNKLLSEVKTRMVLENGLVVHIWQWNDKAKALGLNKYPPAGLIAKLVLEGDVARLVQADGPGGS